MPIQAIDTTDEIVFSAPGESWLIKAGVAVVVASSPAIFSNVATSDLTNRGTVMSDIAVYFGSEAQFSMVLNAAEGILTGGTAGVVLVGRDGVVENHGTISARGAGVELDGDLGQISNDGSIFGAYSGVMLAGAHVTLDNAGSVASTNYGAALGSSVVIAEVTVLNSGSLRGGAAAISVDGAGSTLDLLNTGAIIGKVDLHNGGASTIVNLGSIAGDLLFGEGADSYDGRGGTISGAISGGDGGDRLIAGAGDEALDGGKGVDRIKGMGGDDTITGGLSRDNLNGGRGDDVFVYSRTIDSAPSGFDVIGGWDAGDVIDVSVIDASTVAGFQHLVFGGTIAAGDPVAKGKIQVFQQDGDTFVVADVTGDKVADFEVQISGTVVLTAADFVF